MRPAFLIFAGVTKMYRHYDSNTIYKDQTFKKLTGVCAGVARYYNKPRWMVRGAALASLIIFPMATGVAYVVATMLMRSR